MKARGIIEPSLPGTGESGDRELVARAREGEAFSFERLMRRHNQKVFRAARSIVRNDAEAEDVVQEAFVRAFRSLATFEGRASFATWVTRIAVHEAFARVRRARLTCAVTSGAHDEADAPSWERLESDRPGPEDQATSGELRAILTRAIDSLPEGLRTVFVLREVEGMSAIETGESLGLSPEAVRVRLHRARSALRGAIQRQLDAEVRTLYGFAGRRCDRVVATVFRRLGLPPSVQA